MAGHSIIDLTLDTDSEAETQPNGHASHQPIRNGDYAYFDYMRAHVSALMPRIESIPAILNPKARSASVLQKSSTHRSKIGPSKGSMNDPSYFGTVYSTPPKAFSELVVPPRKRSGDERECLNCAADPDVTCDGEQPCSACSEPGFDCTYPGEGKRPQRVVNKFQLIGQPYKAREPGSEHSWNTPEPQHPLLNSITGSSINRNPLLTERAAQGPTPAIYDNDDFDEVSDCDDMARFDMDNLEGVKNALKLHERRLRTNRESYMRPLLARAKLECVKDHGKASPISSNPFSKMRTSEAINPQKPILSLQIRSHSHGASKKWTGTTAPLHTVRRDTIILPKYRSIGRLGTTFLAANSYVKKYLPYFADEVPEAERKREEDIAKWYQTDHDSMHRQRNCLEMVQLWQSTVEQFVSSLEIQFTDVMWYILSLTSSVRCQTCEKSFKKKKYGEILGLIEKPDERSLRRAQLAADALEAIAGIHIWHILVELDSVKQMLAVSEETYEPASTLCSICFVHNCLTHGAVDEPSDEASGTFAFMSGEGGRRKPMMINDDEEDVNQRISIVVPYIEREDAHVCGIFCVDNTTPVKAILGRRSDGSIGGVYNRTVHVTRPTFENMEECSSHCFWPVGQRIRFPTTAQTKAFEPKLSTEAKQLFRLSLKLHSANQRAPCMIAKDIVGLSCIDAFYYLLATTQQPMHYDKAGFTSLDSTTRKPTKPVQGTDTLMSSELDDRPPFIPCSHDGPCSENTDCTCSGDQVHCEYFCGCDASCKQRFLGCSCAGKNKVCFNDDRCECWAQNRECDPWLCKSCGAVEVLDPANKYREEIRRGRCKNVNLQLDLPARTIKAQSEVQGWGLYAGQDLEIHAFIGEYKGEIVGNQESDRRGSIYHHLGQEYLFVTNNEQQIDGSNFGNKTRFINNSQRNDYINVLAKKLLCYGVQRVMLYARRSIKAGDELLYNYNYPESVTKAFWERGEGPAQVAGAVVAKPALPTNSRMAKVADTQNGQHSLSGKQLSNRHSGSRVNHSSKESSEVGSRHSIKRKRISDVASASRRDLCETIDVADGSGVSDDGEIGNGTDRDSDQSGTETSDDIQGAVSLVRKRRIHPSDRRFGGNAQRKAWDTRKNRGKPDED